MWADKCFPPQKKINHYGRSIALILTSHNIVCQEWDKAKNKKKELLSGGK
jgi:hypothetical protein